jgi:hypothetical protein
MWPWIHPCDHETSSVAVNPPPVAVNPPPVAVNTTPVAVNPLPVAVSPPLALDVID